MAKKLPNVVSAFRRITQRTEAALLTDTSINFGSDLPKKVYFMQGNVKEIVARLQKMTDASMDDKKFPLIALFRDFEEDVIDEGRQFAAKCTPRIAFITLTQPSYLSDEREAKNFLPILYPIFNEFIHQITLSQEFGMPTEDQLKIKKTDCYFFGSNLANKNIFNDYVDAIQIDSISVQVKNLNCP
jgi:hypothetical protein